ncbi:MAG: ABC transporter ATP-binding protein [Cyanobacteria bacterium P01_H01_bin.119]
MTRHASIGSLIWQMIGYARRLYTVDALLWLLITGLPAIPGILIQQFFNALTHQAILNRSAWVWIALVLAVGLARVAVILTGRITKTQHRFTMSTLVRHNLLQGVMQRPGAEPLLLGHARRPISPGGVISFFREDASQIEDTVVGTNEIFGAGVFALGSLGVLLSVNVRLTLLAFLPLIVMATVLNRITDRIKRYRRVSRQATQQVTSIVGEVFASVQAIKVAGAEDAVLAHLKQIGDRRQQLMVRDQLLATLLTSSFGSLVNVGIGVILLVTAQAMGSPTQPFTVGDFALFVYSASYITYFMRFWGGMLTLTKQSEVSFERMAELVDAEAQAIVAHNPLYLKPILGQAPIQPAQPALSTPNGQDDALQELIAQNLTYHYPGTQKGITDVSLRITRGSFTVITGPVGAGKTTLLRALQGLLPLQSGDIYWNGRRVLDPAEVFVPPRSAYTPQVPQLFSTTLRDNILLGLDGDDAALHQAISLAVFDQDLAAMPDGLRTVIGPKGMRLSGGQLQRAAAARMVIRRPDLLIFDDLSSALDIETEQKLWTRLFSNGEAAPGSMPYAPTYLVVSHRRAVLERSDRIIVLNQGRIEMEGTFDELPVG